MDWNKSLYTASEPGCEMPDKSFYSVKQPFKERTPLGDRECQCIQNNMWRCAQPNYKLVLGT